MSPLDQLRDHQRRPRGMGRLSDAHATATVGSIVAGRALRLFLTTDGQSVAVARFQAFACNEQIGPTSVLMELLPGRTIESCRTLGPADLCQHLGGLPWWHLPPVLWGLEALRGALRQLEGGSERPVLDTPGFATPLICRCHGVDEATVRAALEAGDTTLDALMGSTAAGTGCGTCRRDLERLLAAPAPSVAAVPAHSPRVAGRVALLKRIAATLEKPLAELRAAGIPLELWDYHEGVVLLRGTLEEPRRDALERLLKDTLDPTLRVACR